MTSTESPSTEPTTHLVTTPEGRTVAVDEVGPAAGPVVVLLHSSPGSRLLDPDPAATAAHGVRLLTIDRPGYGGSDPLAGDALPSISGQADDVARVLAHLDVAEAGVAGWSHGGRVAAALAARHPDRVRALAVVGTPSPEDPSWIPAEHQAMLDPFRADPAPATAALTAILEGATGGATPPPEVAMAFLAGPGDEALLATGDVRARVDAMLAGAFAQGAAGCAADIVADQLVPWGFDARSIGAPTLLVYSDDDLVAPHHGDWWAAQVAGATRRTTAGVGHLLVVPEWAAILDHLT